MSRTYKDVPWKVQNPEAADWRYGTEIISYIRDRVNYRGETVEGTGYWYKQLPGVKAKKKKELDTSWHWLRSTPSWWTRLMMNRPQRREAHLWEREAVKTPTDELEDLDKPNISHKPHKYYY